MPYIVVSRLKIYKITQGGGEIMTDVKRLKQIVKDSGLKKVYIAERLGLTYQGYLNKEDGKKEFMASEIQKMQTILNLSNNDVHSIFLSKE